MRSDLAYRNSCFLKQVLKGNLAGQLAETYYSASNILGITDPPVTELLRRVPSLKALSCLH